MWFSTTQNPPCKMRKVEGKKDENKEWDFCNPDSTLRKAKSEKGKEIVTGDSEFWNPHCGKVLLSTERYFLVTERIC